MMIASSTQLQFQTITARYTGVWLYDIFVCFDTQKVYKQAQEIHLPVLSFSLLCVLLEHSPKSLTSAQLQTLVWKNVVTGDENVKQRIRMLRLALGQTPENEYIKNLRGKGYYVMAHCAGSIGKIKK